MSKNDIELTPRTIGGIVGPSRVRALLGQFRKPLSHFPRRVCRFDKSALATNKRRGVRQISHAVRTQVDKGLRAECVLLTRRVQERNVDAKLRQWASAGGLPPSRHDRALSNHARAASFIRISICTRVVALGLAGVASVEAMAWQAPAAPSKVKC